MAITQAVCTSFKQELLQGTHDFTATTGDTFKIALYTSSASLDATTTAFSTTNEVSNSGTYTSGGGTLTLSLQLYRPIQLVVILLMYLLHPLLSQLEVL